MALSRAGDVSALVTRLGDAHSRRARENVAMALGRSKSPHAIDRLMELVSNVDEPEIIRLHAARGLGELRALAAGRTSA